MEREGKKKKDNSSRATTTTTHFSTFFKSSLRFNMDCLHKFLFDFVNFTIQIPALYRETNIYSVFSKQMSLVVIVFATKVENCRS